MTKNPSEIVDSVTQAASAKLLESVRRRHQTLSSFYAERDKYYAALPSACAEFELNASRRDMHAFAIAQKKVSSLMASIAGVEQKIQAENEAAVTNSLLSDFSDFINCAVATGPLPKIVWNAWHDLPEKLRSEIIKGTPQISWR